MNFNMCAPQYVALLDLSVCPGPVGPWVERARGSLPGTTSWATCPTSSSASSPPPTSSSTASWATSSGQQWAVCTLTGVILGNLMGLDFTNNCWLIQTLQLFQLNWSSAEYSHIQMFQTKNFAFIFYKWQRKWDKIVFIENAFWMPTMNLET